MTARALLVALSVAVLTIGVASSAAEKTGAAPPKKGHETRAQAKQVTPNKPAPRKVLRLEEMRVEGRIQKPQALFLMPRASVSPGEPERTESFLPKTKQALGEDPF
ncbi:MAG TPA: hypothetical protein VFG53_12595 [Anaeromyxobacter sp.]|nr:hypothetical protein [Anaeromyxobacter sp.]